MEKNISPLKPTLPQVTDFLLFRTFQKGDNYVRFTKTRAALRCLLSELFPEQQSQQILGLIARTIFQKKPPTKRIKTSSWDVNLVLDYWSRLSKTEDLHIYNLSRKTASLLMLATFRRQREMVHLKVEELHFSSTELVITISRPVKNFRINTIKHVRKFQTIKITRLLSIPELCPVRTLEIYLKQTQPYRKFSNLFLTCTLPFTPISMSTFRRWLVQTLTDAGVPKELTTGHSYRSSSTSAAYRAGLKLDDIIAQAAWVDSSQFIKNYCRPLHKEIYQNLQQQSMKQVTEWFHCIPKHMENSHVNTPKALKKGLNSSKLSRTVRVAKQVKKRAISIACKSKSMSSVSAFSPIKDRLSQFQSPLSQNSLVRHVTSYNETRSPDSTITLPYGNSSQKKQNKNLPSLQINEKDKFTVCRQLLQENSQLPPIFVQNSTSPTMKGYNTTQHQKNLPQNMLLRSMPGKQNKPPEVTVTGPQRIRPPAPGTFRILNQNMTQLSLPGSSPLVPVPVKVYNRTEQSTDASVSRDTHNSGLNSNKQQLGQSVASALAVHIDPEPPGINDVCKTNFTVPNLPSKPSSTTTVKRKNSTEVTDSFASLAVNNKTQKVQDANPKIWDLASVKHVKIPRSIVPTKAHLLANKTLRDSLYPEYALNPFIYPLPGHHQCPRSNCTYTISVLPFPYFEELVADLWKHCLNITKNILSMVEPHRLEPLIYSRVKQTVLLIQHSLHTLSATPKAVHEFLCQHSTLPRIQNLHLSLVLLCTGKWQFYSVRVEFPFYLPHSKGVTSVFYVSIPSSHATSYGPTNYNSVPQVPPFIQTAMTLHKSLPVTFIHKKGETGTYDALVHDHIQFHTH